MNMCIAGFLGQLGAMAGGAIDRIANTKDPTAAGVGTVLKAALGEQFSVALMLKEMNED